MKKSRLLLSLVLCMSMLIGGVMSVSATDYTNITEESTESSAQIELNIEIDSTFTVGIPISADIDSATGQGAYQVSVKGDIDPRYKLVVAPVDGYTSTDGDTTENINFLLSTAAKNKYSTNIELKTGPKNPWKEILISAAVAGVVSLTCNTPS